MVLKILFVVDVNRPFWFSWVALFQTFIYRLVAVGSGIVLFFFVGNIKRNVWKKKDHFVNTDVEYYNIIRVRQFVFVVMFDEFFRYICFFRCMMVYGSFDLCTFNSHFVECFLYTLLIYICCVVFNWGRFKNKQRRRGLNTALK